MVAITVRSLPEPVHEALRAMAAREGVSVEGLARRLLAAGGRLALTLSPLAWFARVLAQPGVSLAPMPVDVLMASATLPGDVLRDPADRIIAATARELGHVIVTRDAAFVAYAAARHVDVITC